MAIKEKAKMVKHGRLFVFEGPDGVGKSTLSKEIADRLNATGIPCEYLTFPGRELGTLGRHVYDIHHNPEHFGINSSISSTSLQVLHIAAHIDAIDNRIIPALESGKTIVLDRFWWSTLVYGIVHNANRLSLDAMIWLEKIHWGSVQPTIAFLINRSVPLREEKNFALWEKLCLEYKALASNEQQNYPVRIINNESLIPDAIDQIFGFIYQHESSGVAKILSMPVQNVRHELSTSDNISNQDKQLGTKTHMLFTQLSPAKPTEVFDTFWRFAAERQAIFFRKLTGALPPWTTDPILSKYKFTNAYRASDRVSQYLIKNVIYAGEQSAEEVFFRTIIFKIFNRIDTWELLVNKLGVVSYSDYSFKSYNAVLGEAMRAGNRIYSAAYIMTSGRSAFGYPKKHSNHLKLVEKMMKDEIPTRITELKSMQKLFELLRAYPTIGDFLAYQYATDINYSELTNFTEMDFVVPGPGARDGIRKCFQDFGGLNEIDLIRLMADRQTDEFTRLGLEFQSLWGRPLQLIDCQNLFCEVDKYARLAHPNIKGISGRTRIKQHYRPKSQKIQYWFPPKWGINDFINFLENRNDSGIFRSNC